MAKANKRKHFVTDDDADDDDDEDNNTNLLKLIAKFKLETKIW